MRRRKDTADQSFKERKLLELDRRTRQCTLAAASFRPILNSLRVMSEKEYKRFSQDDPQIWPPEKRLQSQLGRRMEQLRDMPATAIIPPSPNLLPKLLISPNGVRFLLPISII